MPMKTLTDEERACLRRLAREPDTQQACSQTVLEGLVARGLLEKRPLLNLPVNPPRSGYHLTAAGREALAAG